MESLAIVKVAQVNRGVFLVQFGNEEDQAKVVEKGLQMFDKKPIVVKSYSPNIEITKEKVGKVSNWIRIVGLDIKYLGKTALTKIVGTVGKPLRADKATTHKKRLSSQEY